MWREIAAGSAEENVKDLEDGGRRPFAMQEEDKDERSHDELDEEEAEKVQALGWRLVAGSAEVEGPGGWRPMAFRGTGEDEDEKRRRSWPLAVALCPRATMTERGRQRRRLGIRPEGHACPDHEGV